MTSLSSKNTMNTIQHHTCQNGLKIVTQHIPNVKTVALNWGVRAGVATNTHDGESVLLCELIQRGVHGFDAIHHNDALDAIGVKRHISCGVEFLRISAVLLGNRLSEALPLLGACLLEPLLPEEHLAPCKSLCLQSIQSLADNPSHLAAVELNAKHLPAPFNRSAYGIAQCIESATLEQLRNVYKHLFIPNDSILVVAGDLQHEKVIEDIEALVSHWDMGGSIDFTTAPPDRGVHWIQQETSQVHLSFAFDGPNATDDSAILESVAISIFGGATSGRLFTQVRQRRSLCYSVSAQYAPAKDRSMIRMHAGTTPQRSKETAEVCLNQLLELKEGVDQEEFDRTIQRIKSRIVMHGESTAARASVLWGDQYALGRTRSLTERLKEIDAVQFDDVNQWLSNRDFGKMTCVAVGPSDINIDFPAFGL